jgi:hypothetical protein
MEQYFSKVEDNGVVSDVRCVSADYLSANPEVYTGKWVETFIDGGARKNFGSIGSAYDEARDYFVPPKPFPSWVLNAEEAKWEAPIKPPNVKYKTRTGTRETGYMYHDLTDKEDGVYGVLWFWNEESMAWKSIQDLVYTRD